MYLSDRTLSVGVGLSGAVWGVFWLPMRSVGENLVGVWASVGLFGLGLVVLVPVLARQRQLLRGNAVRWLITGAFTGSAFALYATSLLFTEVVRAMLLFYVTPVWSTLLGYLLLGERVTAARLIALVMGLGGLLVVLGHDGGFPLPANMGDWMALASGLGWAYGSVRIYQERYTSAWQPTVSFYLGGLAFVLVMLALPDQYAGAVPAVDAWLRALPGLVVATVLFLAPTIVVIFLGTMRLSPGRIGLLLMSEAIVGIASAALLADERFGLREMVGSALIVGAAFVEVTRGVSRNPATMRGGPLERDSNWGDR